MGRILVLVALLGAPRHAAAAESTAKKYLRAYAKARLDWVTQSQKESADLAGREAAADKKFWSDVSAARRDFESRSSARESRLIEASATFGPKENAVLWSRLQKQEGEDIASFERSQRRLIGEHFAQKIARLKALSARKQEGAGRFVLGAEAHWEKVGPRLGLGPGSASKPARTAEQTDETRPLRWPKTRERRKKPSTPAPWDPGALDETSHPEAPAANKPVEPSPAEGAKELPLPGDISPPPQPPQGKMPGF